ncbi:DUF1349 domain-containing protein [Micromonospora zamorensis]|uniref:DUF1349 domain-containing protein n=1 Tax=Micromonospora zamorensis TaxID=709883 RepID=UPI0036762D4A
MNRTPVGETIRRSVGWMGVAALTLGLVVGISGPARAEAVVDVTAFGADRTGQRDSTSSVERAVAHAKTLDGPVTLVFPRGTYQLFPEDADPHELYLSNTIGADQSANKYKRFGIYLDGVDDFTVDGQGSTLWLHGLMGAFAVVRSRNVTVTNFSFDHAAPKVVDITVAETGTDSDGRGYRVLQIPPVNPYAVSDGRLSFLGEVSPRTGQRYWQYRTEQFNYTQVYNPAEQRTWRGQNPLFSDVASITDLGNQRIRVVYGARQRPSDLGLVYQIRETTRDNAAGFIWESDTVAVTNLKARYLHGFGFLGQLSKDITVSNVQFATDPATGRSTAAFADMIQMSGVRGRVSIVNNLFDGSHDDPINIHGTYLEVTGKSANQLTLRYVHHETAGFPQYHVGDQVEMVRKATMTAVGSATVTAVVGPTGTDASRSLTTMTVTLDRPVPAEVSAGTHAVENVTYTPEVRIVGNTFRNSPTRGILITTRGTSVIENNTFDGLGMSPVYVSSDASSWYESGPVRNLTIRGNTFLRSSSQWPVIWFDPTNTTVDKATPVHRGVTIEGNDIRVGNSAVVSAKSLGGLVVRNNRIQRVDRDGVLALSGVSGRCPAVGATMQLGIMGNGAASTAALYSLSGASGVSLTGNLYDPGLNRRLNAGSTTTSADISSTDPILINQDNRQPITVGSAWVSSDPGVASIASNGVLTTHKAGRVIVRGQVPGAGSPLRTTPVELVVGGGSVPGVDCAAPPQLASSWAAVRPDPRRLSSANDGSIGLIPSATHLWGPAASTENVLLTSEGAGSGTVTVKMSGRTVRGWMEAGIGIYQDDQNYVLLQRKNNNGVPSVKVVSEVDARPEESRKVTPDPAQPDLWLRLTRTGATVTAAYSRDGTTFAQIGSALAMPNLTAPRFAIVVGGDDGTDLQTTFRFREVTVNNKPVPLVPAMN